MGQGDLSLTREGGYRTVLSIARVLNIETWYDKLFNAC